MNLATDVETRVHDFIQQEVLFEEPGKTLTGDSPLLNGIIDSLALMQLVAFLEAEFEVDIEDEDITRDNFGSIASIGSLVSRKAEMP